MALGEETGKTIVVDDGDGDRDGEEKGAVESWMMVIAEVKIWVLDNIPCLIIGEPIEWETEL